MSYQRDGCQRIHHTAGESGGWSWGIGVGVRSVVQPTPCPNLPIPPTPILRPQPPQPYPPNLNPPNANPPDPNLSPLCGESSTLAPLQTFVRRLRSNSWSHSYVSPVVWRIFHVANPLATSMTPTSCKETNKQSGAAAF